MGLRLFFLPNFPGATFIQGGTFYPDSRVTTMTLRQPSLLSSIQRSKEEAAAVVCAVLFYRGNGPMMKCTGIGA